MQEEVRNVPRIIPRLETPQTQRLRDDYPTIEYLEEGYVADWLKTRKDHLLELAKEERQGCNLSKSIGIIASVVGFIFHATSPLAPIGAVLGISSYLWSMYKDIDQTATFSPIPFIRGNFLDLVGSMGHTDLRQDYINAMDGFEELKTHLPAKEREEYLMLRDHLQVVAQYLLDVQPLKRFHTYGWIVDTYILLKGSFPPVDEVRKYSERVAEDHIRIDKGVITAIKERANPSSYPSLPANLPVPNISNLSVPSVQTVIQDPTTVLQTQKFNPTRGEVGTGVSTISIEKSLENLKFLPLHERATTVIQLLNKSGFNVAGCIKGQTTVVAGQQRGGKGTLLAILAILSKALCPGLKIHYFTAGDDVYPFQCEELVCARNFPYAANPDAKVAQELMKFLERMAKAEVGSYSDRILVVDEAIALSGCLSDEEKLKMATFLLTRSEKTGCQTFVVLHASNLTAWIGAKNTSGLSSTFKTSVTFVGCEAESMMVNPMKSINVATGKYFLADANSFGKSIPDGELGKIPAWLKTEIHPLTGMPDPARTLLSIFPELIAVEDSILPSYPQEKTRNEVRDKAREEVQSKVGDISLLENENIWMEEEEVKEISLTNAFWESGSETVQGTVHGSVQRAVQGTVHGSSPKMGTYTPMNLSEPQLIKMIEVLALKMNQTEIIEHLWEVKKGGSESYSKARAEFLKFKGVSAVPISESLSE